MRFTYCSHCAAPLSAIDKTEYKCPNGHTEYNEPVAAVGAVLIRDGKILVSKRGGEPNKGMYDLPGGFFHFNESWQDATIRELSEETGLVCRPDDLELFESYTGLYLPDESTIDLIVLVHDWQGEPEPQDDCDGLEWKDIGFIDSNQFSAPYHGLAAKLERHLAAVTL